MGRGNKKKQRIRTKRGGVENKKKQKKTKKKQQNDVKNTIKKTNQN